MAVDIKEVDGILWVTLNRPEALNAINEDVVKGLWEVVEYVKKNKSVRVVVLTGSGKAFCAGADIKMFSQSNAYHARRIVEELGRALEKFEELEVPVIAAVNGVAVGGGCEIAMACDIIIASDKASFGQPEINLGIIPGAGGTQRLARLIGWKRAMELCLTGERISAEEAERLGLVNRVVPHEKLLEEAKRLAEVIKSRSPYAVMFVKQAVNRGYKMELKDGIVYERELFALSFASEDAEEGLKAFVEKRKPQFRKERV
jgi:enoyl-CoA hydratase